MLYLIYACLILPLPLLAIAWSRKARQPFEFSILTLSAVLFVAAGIRPMKLALLGTDYSNRLYITIGINLVLDAALGFYMAMKGRSIAAVAAAVILALGWLLAGAINSVV